MATPDQASLRVIARRQPTTGADDAGLLDLTQQLAGVGGVLTDAFVLGAAETKTLALPDAVQVVIVTRDNSFKLRLRAGEAQMVGLSLFAFAGTSGTTTALAAGSTVLEGNGTTPSRVEVWAIRTGTV